MEFIRDRLLGGDLRDEFTASSRLFELGVLSSLNTAMLLNFIDRELGATLPLELITEQTFQDVNSIATAIAQARSAD